MKNKNLVTAVQIIHLIIYTKHLKKHNKYKKNHLWNKIIIRYKMKFKNYKNYLMINIAKIILLKEKKIK